MLSLALFSVAEAAVIQVPGDHGLIQDAINASVDGDEVVIAPGEYFETDLDFGGRSITVRGSDPSDMDVVLNTIIDADSLGAVFHFQNAEGRTSTVSGLTITGASGSWNEGGGVLCDNGARPTISSCVIWGNYGGGGIKSQGGAMPLVEACMVTANEHEAGVYAYAGSVHLLRTEVFANEDYGVYIRSMADADTAIIEECDISYNGDDGVYVFSYSNATLERSLIRGNHGEGVNINGHSSGIFRDCTMTGNHNSGVMIDSNDEKGELYNCVLSGNGSSKYDAGLRLGNSTVLVEHCVFYDNYAPSTNSGGPIYATQGSHTTVRNSILWGNEPAAIQKNGPDYLSVTFCDLESGEADGIGNFSSDPHFRAPESGDFHLMSAECGDAYTSPAIDRGRPSDFDAGSGCDLGLGTIRADLGLYGGANAPCDLALALSDAPARITRGETLSYRVSLANPCADVLSFDRVQIDYRGPASASQPLTFDPAVALGGGDEVESVLSIPVPTAAPTGDYTVTASVELEGTALSEDSFVVTVD